MSSSEVVGINLAVNVKCLLRLVAGCEEASAPYNQFTRPLARLRNIILLSFYAPRLQQDKENTVLNAQGSAWSFVKKIRFILSHNSIDVVHVHSVHVAFLFVLVKLSFIFKKLPPAIFTVHCSCQNLKLRNKVLFAASVPFMTRIVFCSKASMDSFSGFYRWLCGSRGVLVTNGVDVDRVELALRSVKKPEYSGKLIICAIGLKKVKNPLCVIKAFKLASVLDAELIFIGSDPAREMLELECRRLGIRERVRFLGTVSREDVYRQLSASHLFISASSTEGMPIAPLEAMLCECSVILSEIPAHREIADVSSGVRLFPVDDVELLAAEITRVVGLSPSERENIGARIHQDAKAHFHLNVMLNKYEEIYSEVVVTRR